MRLWSADTLCKCFLAASIKGSEGRSYPGLMALVHAFVVTMVLCVRLCYIFHLGDVRTCSYWWQPPIDTRHALRNQKYYVLFDVAIFCIRSMAAMRIHKILNIFRAKKRISYGDCPFRHFVQECSGKDVTVLLFDSQYTILATMLTTPKIKHIPGWDGTVTHLIIRQFANID